MDGNLRLAVIALLLPMFPPTNLILLRQLYGSARDLMMPAAGRREGQFGLPVLPLVAIAMDYVVAVAMLALKVAP
ncbi:hypothetical protein [Rhizobium sp. LC145]|jgi:hypothetical protein|uniref:hypothetical protein n=1 Tax=Rhizobium sp. LC145 TaxID=1120688 RepID=UPI000629EEED|nr:hypothetical protein [Rhizobium sp. LC145]KKX28780.1 hypothetical protein YH62_17710 [Rhizobium sp. LC145]TKT45947.1 hypothetical protein FDR95_24680 [Rhizobiaceae bacterium LC148]